MKQTTEWERIEIDSNPELKDFLQLFLVTGSEEESAEFENKIIDKIEPILRRYRTDNDYTTPTFVKDLLALAETKEQEAFFVFVAGQKIQELHMMLQPANPLEELARMLGKEDNDPNIDNCMCTRCRQRRKELGIERGAPMNREEKDAWDLAYSQREHPIAEA